MTPHVNQNSGLYVIVRHARGDAIHWDFMLETGGLLRTWRIDLPPEQLSHAAATAQQIADHPLRFLSYEGPVQHGTGKVEIADSGTYALLPESPIRLEIRLQGRIVDGVFRMEQLGDGTWRLAPADAGFP